MASRRSSTAPTFETDTPEKRRRRRIQERNNRVNELAVDLMENDPKVTTMREARAKAREILELEDLYRKGTLDTRRRGRLSELRRASRPAPGTRAAARHRTARPRSRTLGRSTRRVKRAVTAPFGSAASAGWTFATGAVGLLLLYSTLRDAGAVSAVFNAVGRALARFADPYVALIPEAGELDTPKVRKSVHAATHKGGK